MSTSAPRWADTTEASTPHNHQYAAVRWLVGRHPQVATLLGRLPGVVRVDDDGSAGLDLDLLGDALAALDVHEQAWADAGPTPPDGPVGPVVSALARMSASEVLRVRLLGCWAPGGARLPITSTHSLDDFGRRLLTDWTDAVLAY